MNTRKKKSSDAELDSAIRTSLNELKVRASGGNQEASKLLARIQFDLHCDCLEFFSNQQHSNPSIRHLLRLADFSIPRLLKVAETQPHKARDYAQDRYCWPSYVALTADMEEQFKEAATTIGLGSALGCNITRKTKADVLLPLAIGAIQHLTDPLDQLLSFCFAKFIPDLEMMERAERAATITRFRSTLGSLTRRNWDRWKPIFENYLTLRYGPTWQRWERIPEPWKDNLRTAIQFGVHKEWNDAFGKKSMQAELNAISANWKSKTAAAPIMDWPSPDVARILKRAQGRDSKWGDFQDELLKKCERLVPRK